MFRCSHLGILVAFALVASTLSATVISVSDDIDENYEMDAALNKQEIIEPLQVFLYTYKHKDSKECVKVMTFQLANQEEYFLDSVLVSCDVEPPFTITDNMVSILDIVHVGVVKESDIWAIFKIDNQCIQRRYTDKNWTPLDVIEEMSLTDTQCKQVVERKEPMVPRKEETPTVASEVVPELGNTQGRIIVLSNDNIDNYMTEDGTEDQEESGKTVKMIVSRNINQITKECMILVYINMKASEDFLEIAQITCKDNIPILKSNDLLVYGGLVYLKDKVGEPIWAVFVKDDFCILRTYTDKQHKLIDKDTRKLSWNDCKKVISTQKIDWLPKLPKASFIVGVQAIPASLPMEVLLAHVQELINKQGKLSDVPVPFGYEPLGQSLAPGAVLPPQPIATQPGVPTSFNSLPLTSTPIPPPLTPSPPTVAPPLTTEPIAAAPTTTASPQPPAVTNNSPGVIGGLFSKLGFFNKKPEAQAAPPPTETVSPPIPTQQPSPPVEAPAPPPKKGWFW